MHTEYEYEESKRIEQRNIIILSVLLILIVVTTMFIVGRNYYVHGARVSCHNSDMFLNVEFACEDLPEKNVELLNSGFEINGTIILN